MSKLLEAGDEVMDVLFAVKQSPAGIIELTFIDSEQHKVVVPIIGAVARDLCHELSDLGFADP